MKEIKTTQLYDLPNFDKTIYFIEKSDSESAQNYGNQTGGCACNHPSIKGILHEFAVNNLKLESFNPDWWYNRVYREKGTLDSKIADNIEFEGIKWKNAWDLYKDFKFDKSSSPKPKENESFMEWMAREDKWMEENCPEYKRVNQINEKLEELIIEHPSLLTWKQLKEKVGKDLNEIKPPDVEKVKIVGKFGPSHKNQEAWVFVKILYKNNEVKEGVVSWISCD